MSNKVKPGDQQENSPCTNENVEIGGPLPAPDMIEDVSASGVATCLSDASLQVHGATSSTLPFLQPQKLRLPVTAHTPAENHPTTRHGRIYMWANWATRNGIKFNTTDTTSELAIACKSHAKMHITILQYDYSFSFFLSFFFIISSLKNYLIIK